MTHRRGDHATFAIFSTMPSEPPRSLAAVMMGLVIFFGVVATHVLV